MSWLRGLLVFVAVAIGLEHLAPERQTTCSWRSRSPQMIRGVRGGHEHLPVERRDGFREAQALGEENRGLKIAIERIEEARAL